MITAMIRERRVSRLVVSIAPLVLGEGIEAVGDLDILRLRDACHFAARRSRRWARMSSSTANWSREAKVMPEAVWFGGPQRVEIRQEPAAPVGPDDVRVRALVSGVSAGSELLVYRGSARPSCSPICPPCAATSASRSSSPTRASAG